MIFDNEMKKYLSLSDENKLKKVLNLLELIKEKNKSLSEKYDKLSSWKYSIKIINKIYKVLLEAMIYQQSLNEKKDKQKYIKINNSLNYYLNQEKIEKENEENELKKLLDFV